MGQAPSKYEVDVGYWSSVFGNLLIQKRNTLSSDNIVGFPAFLYKGNTIRVGDGVLIKLEGAKYQRAIVVSVPKHTPARIERSKDCELGDNDLLKSAYVELPAKTELQVVFVAGVDEIPKAEIQKLIPKPKSGLDIFVVDTKPRSVELESIEDMFSWAPYCIHASAITQYRLYGWYVPYRAGCRCHIFRLPLLPTSQDVERYCFYLRTVTSETVRNENRAAMKEVLGKQLVKRLASRDYKEVVLELQPIELMFGRLFLPSIPEEQMVSCYRSKREAFVIPIPDMKVLKVFTGLTTNSFEAKAGTTVEASFPLALAYDSEKDRLLLVISKVEWIPYGGTLFTASANKVWKRWTEPIKGTPDAIVKLMNVAA